MLRVRGFYCYTVGRYALEQIDVLELWYVTQFATRRAICIESMIKNMIFPFYLSLARYGEIHSYRNVKVKILCAVR